jgi:phage anti-repressor protein
MQLMQTKTQIIGNQAIQTVCARQLHQWLGINKDFSNWFKAKIKALELIEGIDYFFAHPEGRAKNTDGRGGHNALHYDITADIGKHISMTTHTQQGRVVRNFFIELEKNFTQELQKQLAVKQAVIDTQKRLLDQFATNTTQKLPKSLEWSGKPWTDRDDSELISLELSRWDYKRIAQKLKRTEEEVSQRASQIKEALSVV